MLSNVWQYVNASSSIVFTEFGIVMLVNPVQPANALSPIFVTEFGMVMLVNSSQFRNALSPIFVTELGIVMFLNSKKEKLDIPIAVIPSSITTSLTLFLSISNFSISPVPLIVSTLSSLRTHVALSPHFPLWTAIALMHDNRDMNNIVIAFLISLFFIQAFNRFYVHRFPSVGCFICVNAFLGNIYGGC